MKENVKRNRMAIIIPLLLYIVAVVLLFWFHPFVASAKEDDTTTKKVPGGNGNTVHIYEKIINTKSNVFQVKDRTAKANDDVEIVGYLRTDDYGNQYLMVRACRDGEELKGLVSDYLSDSVGVVMNYNEKGQLISSSTIPVYDILSQVNYYSSPDNLQQFTSIVTGMKIFKDLESYEAYLDNGSLDGMIRDEVDKSWYLKGVHFSRESGVDAVPEQYRDNVAVYFTWLTDNLQEGDLLEIKTHNYLKKPFGDQISGFHNYITWQDNVSAYVGKYRFLQYDPAKAWVDSLDNKPLFINSYDTDTYYLRPYRNGKTGVWCKVVMGRDSAGRPYAKDISYGDLDDEGDWDEDEDATEEEGGHHGIGVDDDITYPDDENPFDGEGITGIFKTFFDFMKSLPSLLGDLPELVKTIIGFLPDWVIAFIGIAIIVVIILRVVGR